MFFTELVDAMANFFLDSQNFQEVFRFSHLFLKIEKQPEIKLQIFESFKDFFIQNREELKKKQFINPVLRYDQRTFIDFEKILNTIENEENIDVVWQHLLLINMLFEEPNSFEKLQQNREDIVNEISPIIKTMIPDMNNNILSDLINKIDNFIPSNLKDNIDNLSPMEAISQIIANPNLNDLVNDVKESMNGINIDQSKLQNIIGSLFSNLKNM